MNPFVNPKKRSVQLPHGAKDLIDVLRGERHELKCAAKCEYCNASPVTVSIMGSKYDRWCAACAQDLKEFATAQDYKFDFDIDDEEAVNQFRAATQRRQDDFMSQRVIARTPQ